MHGTTVSRCHHVPRLSLTYEVEALSRTALRQIDSALRSGLPLRASRIGLYLLSDIANLPCGFGHSADRRTSSIDIPWVKSLK